MVGEVGLVTEVGDTEVEVGEVEVGEVEEYWYLEDVPD